MIPRRDKAFVFLSGGIDFASSEDMRSFYLRLVQILSKRKKGSTQFFLKVIPGQELLVFYLPCVVSLKCCEASSHAFRSFLLIWYPSLQIMRQKEQSGVLKAKATRRAPLSVAGTSEAAFTDIRKKESCINFALRQGMEFGPFTLTS